MRLTPSNCASAGRKRAPPSAPTPAAIHTALPRIPSSRVPRRHPSVIARAAKRPVAIHTALVRAPAVVGWRRAVKAMDCFVGCRLLAMTMEDGHALGMDCHAPCGGSQ